MIGWGIAAVLVVGTGMVVGIYNRLVGLRNRVKNAWAQIDVQLKRRYDLIPNLVEVAKGYLKHERETLEKVVQAAFGQRRKTLRNALSGSLLGLSTDAAANLLTAGGIDPLRRAETLSVEEFVGLTDRVEAYLLTDQS